MLDEAIARIDAINSGDPQQVVRDGKEYARELLASERRSFWLEKLSPKADPLIQIANRAQHIARWELPRSKFPQGKNGFGQWRKALFKFHAENTAKILAEIGYSGDQIERVKILVERRSQKSDPATQLLTDVSSLVFLENEFEKLTTKRSQEHLLHMIKRTWRKMSAKGREHVRALNLSTSSMKLIDTALGNNGNVEY